MNNLNPIVFTENRLCPVFAARDVPVQFDGDARGLQAQFGHQIGQTGPVRQLLIFSVYVYVQDIGNSGIRGQDDFSQFGDFAVAFGANQHSSAAGREIWEGKGHGNRAPIVCRSKAGLRRKGRPESFYRHAGVCDSSLSL